jgi:hypothetical protein
MIKNLFNIFVLVLFVSFIWPLVIEEEYDHCAAIEMKSLKILSKQNEELELISALMVNNGYQKGSIARAYFQQEYENLPAFALCNFTYFILIYDESYLEKKINNFSKSEMEQILGKAMLSSPELMYNFFN